MKELIAVELYEVENQKDKLIEVINVINKYTDKLKNRGYNITINDITDITNNSSEYINKHYLKELKDICDMFALDFDEVSTKEYNMTHSENMFAGMANAKIELIRQFAKEVANVGLIGDRVFLDYLEITDNIASPKLNYENDIKDRYSHYAKNSKQTEITKALRKLQATINEAKKLGYTGYEVKNFINWSNNEINFAKIEAL